MVISYAREMDEYTPHPTGGVLTGELNKDLVILENNIPVVGSANLEVEIMSSNIPTISRSRECTVCTSGHENDQKMRNVQSVLAVMRMIGWQLTVEVDSWNNTNVQYCKVYHFIQIRL